MTFLSLFVASLAVSSLSSAATIFDRRQAGASANGGGANANANGNGNLVQVNGDGVAQVLGFQSSSAAQTPAGTSTGTNAAATPDIQKLAVKAKASPTKNAAPAGTNIAINGANGGIDSKSGSRPFRQEFSTFATSGPAFDLFILALQQFQQMDQAKRSSYFQVAGIHGLPYIPWDNVPGQGQMGYCTHGSILFPSWHRPYLALYEQFLWQKANGIATGYPADQKSKYQDAARSFRIPYWDWAMNATMPDIVNQPKITINGPKGSQTLDNPLYAYTFNPQPNSNQFPTGDTLSSYKTTVRYPDSNGKSQPGLANAQLQANQQSLHDLTYQLIVDQGSYAPFSNTNYNDGRGGHYNSIEAMHNQIHGLVGNGGHMAVIPYSAFDPIFWLHHANVDRLFAIWQAIHPNSYTTPEPNQEGTYTDAVNSIEDVNTPLKPFHSDSHGSFWNSQTARSTKTFGYSYPEVVDWGVSATQLSANTRQKFNQLYNPSGSLSGKRSLVSRESYGDDETKDEGMGLSNSTNYQYFVNVRVDKSALNEPFFVHFFLGDVPLSPKEWSYAPSLIGTHTILYYPGPEASNRTVYGQIPLNHALLNNNIKALDSSVVIPYLSEHLSWQVQTFDDKVIATNDETLTSLKIFVVGREVKSEGGGSEFPDYGHLSIFHQATTGKAGSLKKDGQF